MSRNGIAEIFDVDPEMVNSHYGFYRKTQDDSHEFWQLAYPFLSEVAQKYSEEHSETN